jgi:hypothetical protein
LLEDESQSDFDELLSGLLHDFKPEGVFEELLVYRIASNFWRYHRLLRAERAAVEDTDPSLVFKYVIPNRRPHGSRVAI